MRHETHREAFSVCVGDGGGGWGREVNMDCNRARRRRLYGVWSYQKTQSCMNPRFTAYHTHKHLHTWTPGRRGAVWFVCVVGAVDWSDGGSNCLMVGFMETLYNACDSLFSACQEGGDLWHYNGRDTPAAPHALTHPPLTAPEGKLSEGDVNLFAC